MGDLQYQYHLVSVLSFAFLTLSHYSLQQNQLCHNEEKSALLEFKQEFTINCAMASDPNSAYPKVNSWGNGAADCCMWDGVDCNQDTGRVTVLDLSGSCLYGTFPISSSLFNLNHLQNLTLASNHFNYSGIPSAFGQFDKLIHLSISNSFFSGQIPSEISKLSSLFTLDLSHSVYPLDGNNRLFGIFNTFFMLEKLVFLDLSGVNLMFPSDISSINSSSVRFNILGLNSCNLTKFPDFLRDQDELKILSLSSNQIQANIPEWFVNTFKDSLLMLDLSNNSLTGFERPSLQLHWKNLKDIDLSNNRLQGLHPSPSNSMVVYKASNNLLTGVIPDKICNAESLKVLDLSGNQMSGPIPQCLGDQVGQSLLVLNLRGNNFSSSIPQTSNTLCMLKMINLSENQLEGTLPPSLASCEMLEVFGIGRNRINDTFPSWLGSLPNLQVLVLQYNKFHGEVATPAKGFGFPSLRIIDLSCNLFSGDFPFRYLEQRNLMEVSEDDRHPSGKSIYLNFW